jgi:hypothetical protein
MTFGTMRTLLATDLARAEARDDSWQQSRVACQSRPSGEWVTSVGYAFAERSIPPAVDALHVIILALDQMRTLPEDDCGASPFGCDTQTRTRRRFTLETPQGAIVVEVGRSRARVGIEKSRWIACAAPILLAISMCWRFDEIERNLDELTAWTRRQLQGQGRDGRLPRIHGRELDHRRRALQTLVVDLPCFEGSLDDPGGYFLSRDETGLYRRLARRLELAAWRTRLDERIEIVEAAVAALVDEHRHRQLLHWEMAVESLILLALLSDIGIHLALTLLE